MHMAFHRHPLFWQLTSVVLLIIALFSHLGYLPLDLASDEPRRALVALEMMLSGDYLTPTLNGAPYFNKPPLYNWLIAASYYLFGNYSSFALRFPMALSLVLYGITIYFLIKPHLGPKIAFAVAMMLVTTSRILLYDSLLGLIDITFSWLTYTAFVWVYAFDKKKNYWALFGLTYGLTALGFLMKGLPSLVFQGLTLLSYFLYTRQFRRLFHPAHFAGAALFLLIVGSYYAAYFTRNDIPLEQVANVLFSESAKRTVVEFGVGQTLLHMLTFPFEMVYHYAPWMLMAVLLFRRLSMSLSMPSLEAMASVKTPVKTSTGATLHPFVRFSAITFFVNFLIYWSSPQVYARYLLMLLPLLYTVFAYFYYERSRPTDWQRRTVEGIFGAVTVVVALGVWVPFFLPQTNAIPGLWWKCGILCMALGFVAWQYVRQPVNRLLVLFAFMALVRIGFNTFVLPGRVEKRMMYKTTSEQAARLTLGAPLYGYKNTIGDDGAADVNSFHIEAVRGELLCQTAQKIPGAFYIADSASLAGERYRTFYQFYLFDRHAVKLVRFD